MEDLVLGALGLVSSAMHWGLDNALPLAVGAILGGPLSHAALGVVGDVLGRTKEVVDSIGSAISGKK
jgi:hypothetical protein